VAADSDGAFVVVWRSTAQDGSYAGVFSRSFDAAGAALGVELQVNTFTDNNQFAPAVSLDAGGRFVVAWESFHQDRSDAGIFAQRLAPVAVLDIDGSGSIAPLTGGLLVLRFLFGFTGPTLVSGAVDLAGCTRCDAGAIAAYLETLN
jgi:hypothetical protein